MAEININSKSKRQVIDLTDNINQLINSNSGVAQVFVCHTTAAITTADLDPGTDLDLLDCLEAMIPQLKWRHPHDPKHTPDHLIASIIGPSISLPFTNGKLDLGVWQRVILIELDGPRHRKIVVNIIKDNGY